MRFLIICSVFPPAYAYGGPPRVNLSLAQSLIRLGHSVLVLTTDANGSDMLAVPKGVETTFEGVPVIYFHRQGRNPFFFAPGLETEIIRRRNQFDICLVRGHWTYINFSASIILKALKKPYVLYPEGCLEPWALHFKGWKKSLYWHLIEKRNYTWANGVIALTRTEIEQVHNAGYRGKITIIPNGVSLAELEKPINIEEGLPSDLLGKRIILFMSRIHRIKALDVLVRAFAEITNDLPDHVLVVAGPRDDAGYQQEVWELVAHLGLQNSVVFLGEVYGQKRLALLHSADVFVLPSHSEGLPLAVLEAAACQVPVVISEACNLPEFGQVGAGVVVQPDVPSIVQGLLSVLASDDERRAMGERAYQLVCERFTWDRVAQQTAAFCEGLLQQEV